MNRFEPMIPRPALAATAVALTTIVLGLSIVVPANLASDSQRLRAAAASTTVVPAPTENAIAPAHAEVSGVREPVLIRTHSRSVPAASQSAAGEAAGPVAVAGALCRPLADGEAADSHST